MVTHLARCIVSEAALARNGYHLDELVRAAAQGHLAVYDRLLGNGEIRPETKVPLSRLQLRFCKAV